VLAYLAAYGYFISLVVGGIILSPFVALVTLLVAAIWSRSRCRSNQPRHQRGADTAWRVARVPAPVYTERRRKDPSAAFERDGTHAQHVRSS
jgi:hypothetical protein